MITYIPFDESRFDFVSIIEVVFPGSRLDDLHSNAWGVYKELFKIGKDSSTEFHESFYNRYRAGWEHMETAYENFIKDVVAPVFSEDFLFQKFPTFRVMLPNNVAVGAFHNDAEFGHPEGEVNFIIPLTNSDDTASVWVESEEGKKDFSPIKLRVGWLAQFNGNKLTHGNKTNSTLKTRVSMDFRVLPMSKYHEDQAKESITRKTKFIEGQYYKRFKKGQ